MSNLNGECTCQFPFFAKKKVGRGEVQDKKVACRPNNGIQHDHLARSRSLSLSLSLSLSELSIVPQLKTYDNSSYYLIVLFYTRHDSIILLRRNCM